MNVIFTVLAVIVALVIGGYAALWVVKKIAEGMWDGK